ncbi:hypothetical protein CEXT_72521 [Caerostris extrusa]|uniref:RING-type domain-containing protein n=1 Tax=Caerostris extrusa TaxID=172846 RepID=A0AAV4XRN0_CAEEX|nr:hypothetical protein CEXT_72521 [Caerostris extrusa]
MDNENGKRKEPTKRKRACVKKRQNTEDGKVVNCSICLDTSRNRKMRLLPCSHSFHNRCIQKWMKSNPKCPICRNSLEEKEDLDDSEEQPSPNLPWVCPDCGLFNLRNSEAEKKNLDDSEELGYEQPNPNLPWICPDCGTFSILIIGEPPAGSIWQNDAFWIDSNKRSDNCEACNAVSFTDLPW